MKLDELNMAWESSLQKMRSDIGSRGLPDAAKRMESDFFPLFSSFLIQECGLIQQPAVTASSSTLSSWPSSSIYTSALAEIGEELPSTDNHIHKVSFLTFYRIAKFAVPKKYR